VLSDANHFSFNPPLLSKKITITVSGDSDGASRRSRHRSHHRIHVDRRQVESKPSNGGQEGCPYPGLWGWLKGCHDSASTPAKPPTP
jgi:hypothetical protein